MTPNDPLEPLDWDWSSVCECWHRCRLQFTSPRLKVETLTGSSVWSLSPQYRCLHSGQGIQSEKPAHHSPTRQVDLWSIDVWSEPKESQGYGAADQKSTSAQGIRVPRRGRIS